MRTINVDFSEKIGKVKPMHAVNNGPTGGGVRGGGNAKYFKEAGIPYARLHDSAFYWTDSVDVHKIFVNFDADVNDPNSYDFTWTDKYIKTIIDNGVQVFYRLGASIEHRKKVGTHVPKDYTKWAQICEHIIMHYNCGWANGFEYGIDYWEIWNEFDCKNADGSNPCWQGTVKQFGDFFSVVAKYLKDKFPTLKIGGPAICNVWNDAEVTEFFDIITENKVELDFVSYHRYGKTVEDFIETIQKANGIFAKYGYDKCEKILNEWNYIKGWLDDEWAYSLKTEKNYKGAAFLAGVFLASHAEDLDMLMYYDARPSGMNGMFDRDDHSPLKPYYPFKAFNNLYKLENATKTSVEGEYIYALSATNDTESGIMFSFFDDEEKEKNTTVKLNINGLVDGKKTAKFYIIDEDKNLELVKTKKISKTACTLKIKVNKYSVCYVEIV
ncbi:MAG: hypothetical protein J6V68_05025 [Clostridia bacterium]|nr:hypothetical protein [Clostridia bacterium]